MGKPGARGRGRVAYTGKIGAGRVASLNCVLGTITVHLLEPDDTMMMEPDSPNITVLGRGSSQLRNFSWQLTSMTGEELARLRDLMNLAFDLAEPVVAHRDRVANEALERGDDTYARIFRQKPLFVVRPARRKVERALGAELHNALVARLEAHKDYIMLNVNDLKEPAEDFDFGGPDEYAGEDAEDADLNIPLEK